MAITYDETQKVFKLDTADTSYLIGITPEGYAGHIYYGKKLTGPCGSYVFRMREHPAAPSVSPRDKQRFLDGFPFEYPTAGAGDFRPASLEVEDENGRRVCELFFKGWKVLSEKPALTGMPCSYAGNEEGVETLVLTLEDRVLGVETDLFYTVFPEENIITRRTEVRNGSESRVTLRRALSASIDMDEKHFERITLPGAWARERHIERRRIARGCQSVGSCCGITSPQYNAFHALVTKDTNESSGEVYAMSFIYSGNFTAEVFLSEFDSVRMNMGINPQNFGWVLEPGASFETPEAVLNYSAKGLGLMTRQFHDFFRNHLIRSPWLHRDRPVLVNNWEATYFNFNTEKLLSLARTAADCGIEMLVMDDGWFGRRNDDNSSLGDWWVNEEKLGSTLAELSDGVHALGLKFGIWFEPEMVNPDSDLYRAHPDYAIEIPGRNPTLSRNQLVLDISRKEVRDYAYECVAKILRSVSIDYVKWDMNRLLTDLASTELDAEHSGEQFHRYVLGVYDMQGRLMEEFPELLLENCASGGARFDAGMMYYSPQIWCSDDTDAIERLRIQEGTALVYPLSTMGAHVSKCPNEQMGRFTRFETRSAVAMSGTFGYELDLTKMPEEDRAQIPGQVALYHRYHGLIAEGDYYRLHSWNSTETWDAWMSAAKDGSEAVVTYVQVLGRPFVRSIRLQLQGLEAAAEYEVISEKDGSTAVYRGDELMNIGLPVLPMGDFSSVIFGVKRI